MEKYKNKIFNQSCESLMDSMISDNFKVDLILTSPPYNTGRLSNSEAARKNNEARYDIYLDDRTPGQYREWCVELFSKFSNILKENGVVLWNVSYGNDVTVNLSGFNVLWLVIADLIERSDFCVADKITWKKKSALPNNVSPNKLTRITEDVFVFCRKSEIKTFYANKRKVSESVHGQIIYENVYNLIEAANNDGSNDLNKATFSSEFVCKLLKIYAPFDGERERGDCIRPVYGYRYYRFWR